MAGADLIGGFRGEIVSAIMAVDKLFLCKLRKELILLRININDDTINRNIKLCIIGSEIQCVPGCRILRSIKVLCIKVPRNSVDYILRHHFQIQILCHSEPSLPIEGKTPIKTLCSIL